MESKKGDIMKYRKLLLGLAISVTAVLTVSFIANGKSDEKEIIASSESENVIEDMTEETTEEITIEQVVVPRTASAPTAENSAEEQKILEANEDINIEESEKEEPVPEEPALVIADVTNYVNIRDRASEDGEIVGKLYDDSVGTLLEVEDGWYKIESGCVTGYVKSEYVLTGNAAKEKADQVGIRMAKVVTTTLKVRMEPSLEAKVLGLVPEDDLLVVSEELDGFVKVSVEEGEGYVSTDYVDVYTENVVAESIKDEQERLAREEEERKKAEEAARKAIEQRNAEKKEKTSTQTAEAKQPETVSVKSNSDLGQQIVNYAVQFVGNPYVYGGTSLTNGADCSGFVMSVYASFGISLPRTSGEQGKSGSSVASLAEAVPGDLVWYSGHIGIYMGNNQLVHASNPSDGIKISDVNYRPFLGIRRIV